MTDQLQVVEENGQRVLTTAQLAEVYGTDKQIIVNNFNRNKDRYTQGKHFIALQGEDKKRFLNLHQNDLGSKNTQILYLWTEKGAWLHAKSLNTDEAWEAYEKLVDEYYRIRESVPKSLSQLEIMQLAINQLVEQEQKVKKLEAQQQQQNSRLEQIENKIEKRMTDEFEMQLVTPTQLGKMFEPAQSGKSINQKLQAAGLQWRVGGEWVATVDGKKYSSSEPVQAPNGKMVYQLKWQRRVKELLMESVATA